MKKVFVILFLIAMTVCVIFGCSQPDVNEKAVKTLKWEKHANGYQDLGNYIIQLDEFTEGNTDDNYEKAREFYESGKVGFDISEACTACAKLDRKGDVLIGRNLDNKISMRPAFLIKTAFGKYPTLSVRYIPSEKYVYGSVDFTYTDDSGNSQTVPSFTKKMDAGDEEVQKLVRYMPFSVTDAINSKGLYMEVNVREPNEDLVCFTGTNPGKTDVYSSHVVALVTQNCATVQEAVDYMKNDINIKGKAYSNIWMPTHYAWMIGDATGEFGVIEIAQNEVNYIPYANGQGNFYLTPKWAGIEFNGSGQGRLHMAQQGLEKVWNQSEMLEHMKTCMWAREMLDFDYTELDSNGNFVFKDKDGNESIDWRSDLANLIPFGSDVDAKNHTPMTQSDLADYLNDVGIAVVHYLKDAFDDMSDEDIEALAAMAAFVELQEALGRSNCQWMYDQSHADYICNGGGRALLKEAGHVVHSQDLLTRYYAKGPDKDDLRKEGDGQGHVFTTSGSFAVNCAKKNMLVKFWEDETAVYSMGF